MKRKISTIIPSVAPRSSEPSIRRLLDPARFYDRPRDVLADASLERDEKRAILCSWASDACAVEFMPALRKPPGAKVPIHFDEIMQALQTLDRPHSDVVVAKEPKRRAGSGRHLDA